MRLTEDQYAKLKRGEKILPSEHESQAEFFDWWRRYAVRNDLPPCLCFAIPNGGKRHPRTAGMLKTEGVTAGVSDIFLAQPRAGHHGLFIEMKRPPNTLTTNQTNFMREAANSGYAIATAWSAYDAIRAAKDYLEGRLERPLT